MQKVPVQAAKVSLFHNYLTSFPGCDGTIDQDTLRIGKEVKSDHHDGSLYLFSTFLNI
jgi:hypothetical protein